MGFLSGNKSEQGSYHPMVTDSIIIEIPKVYPADEKTPLLGKSTLPATVRKQGRFTNVPLLLLGFLLIAGVSIATYLLEKEGRSLNVSFGFDLVNRDAWSAFDNIEMGNALNHSNILHVLIIHTRGEECIETGKCVHLLRSLQEFSNSNEKAEIPYNFAIGGDGQTYEARGWNYESGLQYIPRNSSLVIGFIGNFTAEPPPEHQLAEAWALIIESLRRQKLHPNYQIYGVRNLTVSQNDGDELFKQISKWKNFNTLLEVL